MKRNAVLFVILVLTAPAPSLFAYTDDVRAGIEEVWDAACKVMQPMGIKKKDEKNRKLQSRWAQDEVERRNELFRGITSQIYRRRYRMKVSLTEAGGNVQVSVKGDFEEQPKQSPVTAPWRKLKPQMIDYDLERAFFMRVLAQMAKDHGMT